MSGLHIYTDGDDFFVANSAEDARQLQATNVFDRNINLTSPVERWRQLPDNESLSLQGADYVEELEDGTEVEVEGEIKTKSCGEWAKKNGRGLLTWDD